ncbi:PTS sugar transporter subunit IIA [Marinitenerispora sediminis]|uniref:PTS fructose transporter subunit IIA n=1 Tax=Marinitenerispora sediminis TaxID=1931232 RepID=A0A368T4Q1_9ACTN|nr:PTS sugar transporter subunit IIA [Marinitenerispora sediminis]RCV53173.1 PTS fructose transporter subunit IIA [Marinitenerispora sediminis]RCV53714.1 PTS fructose transporter subunit IIA [Marinitenerispora sediminis]RCV58037.1 PTS fructose transporter subunit IIA [Marinitenerispora sediminis]
MSESTPRLITADLVLPGLAAADREDATRQLAALLHKAGRVTDLDGFLADVRARESQMPTGLPGRVGLPHARSAHVTVPSLAVGRCPAGVDFQGPDGTATLVFLIAAPTGGDADHMRILAALARRLVHAEFRSALLDARDAAEIADTVTREVVVS